MPESGTPPIDPNAPANNPNAIFGVDADPTSARVILLPVPFDATTSYRQGTCNGPGAILSASSQLDLYDLELERPYEAGLYMLPEASKVREWNTTAKELIKTARMAGGGPDVFDKIDACGNEVNQFVAQTVKEHLARGKIVGTVGGDHSVAFGAIEAHLEKYPDMGILQIDAHADLRPAYEGYTWSHASVMHNVITRTNANKLVQVGIRDFCETEYDFIRTNPNRITTFFDEPMSNERCRGRTFADQVQEMVAALPQEVYLSFDIDGLDPSLCPHTGTPVPGGLTFRQATFLIGQITASGRQLIGFDLCEVAPGPDGNEWDGNVGMRLLYKMCGHAVRSAR